MRTEIIAMTDVNGVIGVDGQQPFRSKADLERFRLLTTGHGNNALIMGRETHNAIGRALPDRHNVIVSRCLFRSSVAPDADTVKSIGDALSLCEYVHHCDYAFVIGGHNLYLMAMDFADLLHLTIMDTDASNPNAKRHTYFPGFASLMADLPHLPAPAVRVVPDDGFGYAFVTIDLEALRAYRRKAVKPFGWLGDRS